MNTVPHIPPIAADVKQKCRLGETRCATQGLTDTALRSLCSARIRPGGKQRPHPVETELSARGGVVGGQHDRFGSVTKDINICSLSVSRVYWPHRAFGERESHSFSHTVEDVALIFCNYLVALLSCSLFSHTLSFLELTTHTHRHVELGSFMLGFFVYGLFSPTFRHWRLVGCLCEQRKDDDYDDGYGWPLTSDKQVVNNKYRRVGQGLGVRVMGEKVSSFARFRCGIVQNINQHRVCFGFEAEMENEGKKKFFFFFSPISSRLLFYVYFILWLFNVFFYLFCTLMKQSNSSSLYG